MTCPRRAAEMTLAYGGDLLGGATPYVSPQFVGGKELTQRATLGPVATPLRPYHAFLFQRSCVPTDTRHDRFGFRCRERSPGLRHLPLRRSPRVILDHFPRKLYAGERVDVLRLCEATHGKIDSLYQEHP